MEQEKLTQSEAARIDAALHIGKQQEAQAKTEEIFSGATTETAKEVLARLQTGPSEIDKLRAEMMQMMKTFAEQNQKMAEENTALQTELKYATLKAQQPQRVTTVIPQLPEGLKEGQEVTYINHAGRPEHGVVQEISDISGTVILEINGKHENDIQRVADVKFGDKMTRGTFTMATPPAKPTTSLPKHHAKGLQVPTGA